MESTGTFADTMQDDTDMGFLAYVLEHADEFKIHQVVHAFA